MRDMETLWELLPGIREFPLLPFEEDLSHSHTSSRLKQQNSTVLTAEEHFQELYSSTSCFKSSCILFFLLCKILEFFKISKLKRILEIHFPRASENGNTSQVFRKLPAK